MWSKPGQSALLALALASGCTDGDHRHATVQDEVIAELGGAPAIGVIVSFDDPAPTSRLTDPEAHRAAVAATRDALVAAAGGGFVLTRAYAHVPAAAGRLTRVGLNALTRSPVVSFIQIDSAGHGSLNVAVPAIGGDVARRDQHVSGKGVRVAVLDTGVSSSHPDLKTSLVSIQHCFSHNACPPDNDSESVDAEDDNGHGTHVSGIITADGAVAGPGFAPDAEIVAVKVNDQSNAGFVSDWVAGLDWVFDNLPTLDVRLVNVSLSSNSLYGSAAECDRSQPALAAAVKILVDAGVAIFASAGNEGSPTKVSAPACNTGVIAVGATYKSNQGRQPSSGTYAAEWGSPYADCADSSTALDKVACFTNSGPRLDLVAPGAVIVSDVLRGQSEALRGSSLASATAAGVAALMLECDPTLDPAALKDILTRTSVTVLDAKNGGYYPSIRASAAVKEACHGQPVSSGGTADGGAGADVAIRDASLAIDGGNRDAAALDTLGLRDGLSPIDGPGPHPPFDGPPRTATAVDGGGRDASEDRARDVPSATETSAAAGASVTTPERGRLFDRSLVGRLDRRVMALP